MTGLGDPDGGFRFRAGRWKSKSGAGVQILFFKIFCINSNLAAFSLGGVVLVLLFLET